MGFTQKVFTVKYFNFHRNLNKVYKVKKDKLNNKK